MTIDDLRNFGANVDEGLARCFGNESFYLRLVGMGLSDANFDRLKEAMAAKNTAAAFEAAHALKGSIGNLALTPLFNPISALTELLRGQTGPVDGDALMAEITAQLEKAKAL